MKTNVWQKIKRYKVEWAKVWIREGRMVKWSNGPIVEREKVEFKHFTFILFKNLRPSEEKHAPELMKTFWKAGGEG